MPTQKNNCQIFLAENPWIENFKPKNLVPRVLSCHLLTHLPTLISAHKIYIPLLGTICTVTDCYLPTTWLLCFTAASRSPSTPLIRSSSSLLARLRPSASSCTSFTLLLSVLISAVSWEILSAPKLAEPGAGMSPLSRLSTFSFRFASSDAEQKRNGYSKRAHVCHCEFHIFQSRWAEILTIKVFSVTMHFSSQVNFI